MSMDALVEALGNDAGYRSHFFSLFANKKIVIIMRTRGKGTHQMGLQVGTNL